MLCPLSINLFAYFILSKRIRPIKDEHQIGVLESTDLVLFTRGLIFQRFPRPRRSPAPAPCNGCNVPLCTGTTYCHGAGEGRHRSQTQVLFSGTGTQGA